MTGDPMITTVTGAASQTSVEDRTSVDDEAGTGASAAPKRRLPDLSHPYASMVVRWAFLVAVIVGAYWQTMVNLWIEMVVARSAMTYLLGGLLLAAIAAISVTVRRTPERPIYDRQTDAIVGMLLLALALCFQALLRPRYQSAYLVLHVDLVSLVLFLMGGLVLLFGLRPMMRYRWVWVLLIVMLPYPYRVSLILLGGSRVSAGAVMIVYAMIVAAIAAGPIRRRAVIAALAALALGAAALCVVALVFPTASPIVYQLVPSVFAALVVALAETFLRRGAMRWWRPGSGPPAPLTAPNALRSGIALALMGAVIHFFPSPEVKIDPGYYFTGLDTRPPLAVPANWQELDNRYFDWAYRLYGPDAIAVRQEVRQRTGSAQFDVQARPRIVMIDSIQTAYPVALSIYSATSDNRASGDRVSARVPVMLDHNISGFLQTAVDDRAYLTYNRLTWRLTDGERTQVVSLMSVDNHEPDVRFPEPQLSTMRNVGIFATILLRGNLVVEDLEPSFKDRDLLVGLANKLIDTQIDLAGK